MQRYNEKEIWTNKVIYTYGKFEWVQACSGRNKLAKRQRTCDKKFASKMF
jgi:hypothetical protein